MIRKIILSLSWLALSGFVVAKELVIGRLDGLPITREASELVCLGFESDHPKNKCREEFVDYKRVLDDLVANKIQVAIIPEELLAKYRGKNNLHVLLPLFQQYLIVLTNGEFSFADPKSLTGKNLGVASQLSEDYRVTPLLSSLNIPKKNVTLQVFEETQGLITQFCHYGLDGVLLMTNQSSALARELTTACDGKISSLSEAQQTRFLRQHPVFYKATIPAKLYWRMDEDVNTFSSRFILVSNKKPEVITMLEASMEHIMDEVMIPSLRQLVTPEEILQSYRIKTLNLHPMGEAFMTELINKIDPTIETLIEETREIAQ